MPDQVPPLVASASDPGLQRDQNEDRLLVDTSRGIFCVVDGVGGHPGGEHASEIAVALLGTRLARETGSPAERLREAITLANNAILEAAQRDPALAGMTCVLTAAVVTGRQLTIGHVGDTRLYKVRDGSIHKLTRDHSPVGEREDAGELTESEAMQHPRRNEVYRDVGAHPRAPDDEGFVEIVETSFEADAALVLCSDGLSDQVSAASLRSIVESHAGDPALAVGHLIRAANDAGGKDNVSVIVVEGEGFAAAARSSRRRRTSQATGPRAAGRNVWLLLGAGAILGLLAATVAAWFLRPDLLRPPPRAVTPAPAREPRTWRVGLSGDADTVSLAGALDLAQPGDTIRLSPGDYREPVAVRRPITIDGPRDAIIRPPLGATPGWTAVTVTDTSGARLAGFTIAGGEGHPLAIGIRVEHSDLVVDGLVVSGATEAGLLVGDGGRVSVSSSVLRDNGGSAILARRGAQLSVTHTAVLRNGTTPGRLQPGIRLEEGSEASLVGNAVGDNGGGAIAGWPPADLPGLLRDNLVRPVPRLPSRRTPPAQSPPSP